MIASIEVREEVLRKIGRNVVNFQKMEAMLKFLNNLQAMSGSVEGLRKVAAAAQQSKLRKSMGHLTEEFLKSAYSSRQTTPQTDDANDVVVSFSFRIEAEPLLAAERKRALRSVVRERNDLIHKWLATFDPNSNESCTDLGKALDEQHEKMWPEFEALRALVMAIREHAEHLGSVAFALREQIEGG